MAKLVIAGSFFRRLDIRWHTWISHDGHTREEIDHILTRDISLIVKYRMYRGAEPPANSDNRLVVGRVKFQLYRRLQKPPAKRLDVASLLEEANLATKYSIAVRNKFQALAPLNEDAERAWSSERSAITSAASDTIGLHRPRRRPWLTDGTLDIVDHK